VTAPQIDWAEVPRVVKTAEQWAAWWAKVEGGPA